MEWRRGAWNGGLEGGGGIGGGGGGGGVGEGGIGWSGAWGFATWISFFIYFFDVSKQFSIQFSRTSKCLCFSVLISTSYF